MCFLSVSLEIWREMFTKRLVSMLGYTLRSGLHVDYPTIPTTVFTQSIALECIQEIKII